MNESKGPKRSLANYKSMHRDRARKQGVEGELASAQTLTYARVVLFGEKPKVINCSSCHHKACVCKGGK